MKKCLFLDKHEHFGKTTERCFCCNAKVGLSYTERLNKRIEEETTQEQRQQILDLLRDGLNVGQVCGFVGLDLDIVSQVICNNIGHKDYSFLNEKAL